MDLRPQSHTFERRRTGRGGSVGVVEHAVKNVSLAEQIRRRAAACGATQVFAIDGRSGSGKTALALELADELACPILHLENVYPGWHGLDSAVGQLRHLLAALAIGETGTIGQWDWHLNRPKADLVVVPPPTLIVEGVGAGAASIRPFLSYLIWLEAPTEVRKARALARDGEVYEPWWDAWAEQEDAYLLRDRPKERADVIMATA